MFEKIGWNLFLQAKSKERADKILVQFSQAILQDIVIMECEQYWKDKSLFQAKITSPLNEAEIPTAIFMALQVGSKIANRWIVNAPQAHEEDKWEFNGWAYEKAGFHITGLVSAHFRISNFD